MTRFEQDYCSACNKLAVVRDVLIHGTMPIATLGTRAALCVDCRRLAQQGSLWCWGTYNATVYE